jgi:hypothetical protein
MLKLASYWSGAHHGPLKSQSASQRFAAFHLNQEGGKK